MRRIFLAIAFAVGLFAGTSQASVITFQNLGVGPLGAYSESGFVVTDVTDSWSATGVGHPGPAVVSASVGFGMLGVSGQDYSTFTFAGLEVAPAVTGRLSLMTIIGSLGGVEVMRVQYRIAGITGFVHYSSPDSSAELDTLSFSFFNTGGARPIVDNIEVNGIASTATPEPATLASAGLAVVAGLVARRRRRAA